MEDDDVRFEMRYGDPFATPAAARDPARRLRGRLAAPVTVWTAGTPDDRAGITVSSVIVVEGEPARVIGVVGPLTDFVEVVGGSGRFVIHVLAEGERRLADAFAGAYPGPEGPFAGLDVDDGEFGPRLRDVTTVVFCRLESSQPAGWQQIVTGAIDHLELSERDRPLVRYRGEYRTLRPSR